MGVSLRRILNEALREDSAEVMEHVALITRTLNAQCVTRKVGSHIKWPKSNTTFRGSALPLMHRGFFTVGKKYRVPMFLATSSSDDVPFEFMGRLDKPSEKQNPPHQEPTLCAAVLKLLPLQPCPPTRALTVAGLAFGARSTAGSSTSTKMCAASTSTSSTRTTRP